MYTTPELANAIQRDRHRQVTASMLARIAAGTRARCTAPANLIERIVRLVRPATAAC